MSATDYLKLLRQTIWVILGLSIMVALVAYWWEGRKPAQFEGVLTLTVIKKGSPGQPPVFNYDDYYSLQASGYLTDLISGWLVSPNVVGQIFDQANLPLPGQTAKQLAKVFLYRKPVAVSGVLSVSVKTGSPGATRRLAEAAGGVIQSQLATFKNEAQLTNDFQLIISDPLVLEQKVNPLRQAVAVGLASLVLVSLIIITREYIRR